MMRRARSIDPKRMRIALIVAAVLLLIAVPLLLTRPHENRYEREARRITQAIVANDLSPVAADFTPNTRAKFTRETVGLAADRFNSLGAFRSVRETTKPDAPPGAHDFVAVFERGSVPEQLRYEAGGQIVTFHYGEPDRS